MGVEPALARIGQRVVETQRKGPEVTTLFVLWPKRLLASPPPINLLPGYGLRTYRRGDEDVWLDLCSSVGWREDEGSWRRYASMIIPEGLFFVDSDDGEIVGTAGATNNSRDGMFPDGGEVGDLAVRPSHRGNGLGAALTAAATGRLIEGGYASVRAGIGPDLSIPNGTADENTAALRTYLNMGYVPLIYSGASLSRWRAILDSIC